MFDYGHFYFACPPYCNHDWFGSMMFAAGFPAANKTQLTSHFYGNSNKLRVSLVKNPKRWLETIYDAIITDREDDFPPYTDLPNHSFDGFVRAYVNECPGEISKLLNSYEGDTIIRVEDLPQALHSLLSDLGIPEGEVKQIHRVTPTILTHSVNLDRRLIERLIEAERDLLDRYDYTM